MVFYCSYCVVVVFNFDFSVVPVPTLVLLWVDYGFPGILVSVLLWFQMCFHVGFG